MIKLAFYLAILLILNTVFDIVRNWGRIVERIPDKTTIYQISEVEITRV